MSEGKNKFKVAYIHGRPCSHPMQQAKARALSADFYPVDFRMRWHDLNKTKFYRYTSMIVCALTFPSTNKYDLFLGAGAHSTLPLMRVLKKIKKSQKIAVHFGDEMLYFLATDYYPATTKKRLIKMISHYDALICEGKMLTDIAKELFPKKKIYTDFNGIPETQEKQALEVIPNLKTKNILFIAVVENDFRLWYKGLDLMIESFQIAWDKDNSLTFTIIGADENFIRNRMENINKDVWKAIKFVGYVDNIYQYLSESSLYLHCARGDAFPTTILIAAAAGIPSLTSNKTGTQEVVRKVDHSLIIPIDSGVIAQNILNYFNLDHKKKLALSHKFRVISKEYTEKKALKNYVNIVNQIMSKD